MQSFAYKEDDHPDYDDDRESNEPIGRCLMGEINVTFSGTPVKSDYGVPGSPAWFEMEDLKIRSIEILGVEVSTEQLPPELIEAINGLGDQAIWD